MKCFWDIFYQYILSNINASDKYTGNMGDSFVAAGVANSDLNGNAITKGISIFLARWNLAQEKSWATATFDIGGKLAVLETQLILVQYTNTTNFDTTVYFYGDGRLLASYNLLPNTEPIDIKLSVIGINNLEIKASDNIAVAGGTAWALKDAILLDTEKSVTGVKEFINFTDKLPKLPEDSVKQFLAFVYNCADYEKQDLSNDMAYNLLIGNYRIFNSIEQIKTEISDLSLWIRASMNKQAGNAEYRVDYLTDDLLTFWESQYSGMSGLDSSIINEVTKKLKSYVQEGIEGFLASSLAKASDIVITENTFQWSNLMLSSYKDFIDLPNKIQDCVDKIYSFEVTQDKLSQYVSDDYFDNINNLPNTDASDNRNIYIIVFGISTILFIGLWMLRRQLL